MGAVRILKRMRSPLFVFKRRGQPWCQVLRPTHPSEFLKGWKLPWCVPKRLGFPLCLQIHVVSPYTRCAPRYTLCLPTHIVHPDAHCVSRHTLCIQTHIVSETHGVSRNTLCLQTQLCLQTHLGSQDSHCVSRHTHIVSQTHIVFSRFTSNAALAGAGAHAYGGTARGDRP